MIDFRLYRLAFAPTLLAVVVVMFSLEGAPDALEPATPPATFEGDRATAQAGQVTTLAPQRQPGSPGDARVADLVAQRFEAIPAGAVSEQTFEAEFEGEQVTLRNVLLTLPGDAGSTVVVLAARDAARDAGAATSAAATGVLIELANALGVAGREKTFVLASTSGAAAGAAGARELLASLPERDSVAAVIVIAQPGASERRPPFVVNSSTGPTSGSVQLERTAELAVEAQAQEPSSEASALTQLARLALPSGLGDQAPLIAEGIDAVAISSAGERPLADSEELAGANLDAFGRAVQSTVDAVDISTEPLAHGPDAHLELADNLVPGWTLALLALALIVPAAVAAVDGCARAARRRQGLGAGLAWAAGCGLPLAGALAMLYGLAIVGVIPRPPYPFDPALHELGTRDAFALALIVMAAVATVVLLRRSGARAVAPAAAVPAVGLAAAASSLLVWLANPYLALLIAPAAHVWLLAARPPGKLRVGLAAVAVALACVPIGAALIAVADALELGGEAPWTFVLMIADGQLGLAITLPGCFLAGALAAAISASLSRDREIPAEA